MRLVGTLLTISRLKIAGDGKTRHELKRCRRACGVNTAALLAILVVVLSELGAVNREQSLHRHNKLNVHHRRHQS